MTRFGHFDQSALRNVHHELEAGKTFPSRPYLGGYINTFQFEATKPAVSMTVSVFFPKAALAARAVDVLIYAHGLLRCKPIQKNLPEDFITAEPFNLGKIVDSSNRSVILVVPYFEWGKGPAAVANPGNLNDLVDAVLMEAGTLRSGPPPLLSKLILAGHSRAYGFLEPLAKAHHDPERNQRALARTSDVWMFDSTYQCDVDAWMRWLNSKPDLNVSVFYRNDSGKPGTASCGRAFLQKAQTSGEKLKVTPLDGSVAHCAIPGMFLGPLLKGAKPELTRQQAPVPKPRDSQGTLRARIVAIAEDEWHKWNQGTIRETDPAATPLLAEYYRTAVGQSHKPEEFQSAEWQSHNAWSAVFVSYVMRKAGAGDAFQYGAKHTTYIAAAKRAALNHDGTKFQAFRMEDAAVELGDILCHDRRQSKNGPCSGTTWENVESGGISHGEIVVEINREKGYAVTIGGNTSQSYPQTGLQGDTVGKHRLGLDSKGSVIAPTGQCPFFAILKPPSMTEHGKRDVAASTKPKVFEQKRTKVSRDSDRDVAYARSIANKPVPGMPGTTIEQLVDKWRRQIAPEIPLPLLIAFIRYESAGFEDATHGTANNNFTSPPFYELGLFQTPAGLHGRCSSGDYRSCEFGPPGKEKLGDPSEWYKLCQKLSGDCKDWKNPEMQVRIGLQNLENSAATIRAKFRQLFTDPGGDWDLRAAVLLPFAAGPGAARQVLRQYQAASTAVDDQSWERLGQMTFVRKPGGKRYVLNSTDAWKNINEKMALAAKLGNQPQKHSDSKELESELEVPDLQKVRNSPQVQQLIKFENIKKYRPSVWADARDTAQAYWSDPFLVTFWKIREADNHSSLSLGEHGGVKFSIEKKALSDLVTEETKKRILEHVGATTAEVIFGEGAEDIVGVLGFSLQFIQMMRDIENERMLGKVGPEGDKWRREQQHRFVLGILAEEVVRGTDTSPGEFSYYLAKQYTRFKRIADKYAEYSQLEHQLGVYGDHIPDRPPDVMNPAELEMPLFDLDSADRYKKKQRWIRRGDRIVLLGL